MCTAEVSVTIVDTTVYDTMIDMGFIAAMGGAYDTYTELFKYR